MYFRKLGENKDSIILPKLKTNNYNYNIKQKSDNVPLTVDTHKKIDVVK